MGWQGPQTRHIASQLAAYNTVYAVSAHTTHRCRSGSCWGRRMLCWTALPGCRRGWAGGTKRKHGSKSVAKRAVERRPLPSPDCLLDMSAFHFWHAWVSCAAAGRRAPQTWRPLLHWRARWRACGSSWRQPSSATSGCAGSCCCGRRRTIENLRRQGALEAALPLQAAAAVQQGAAAAVAGQEAGCSMLRGAGGPAAVASFYHR